MPSYLDALRSANVGAIAQMRFVEPTITAYNRLEARPRTLDFARSLRAEVRDALWFVTRQWQLGELEADDAASPVDARLATRLAPFDRVSIGGAAPVPYDETVPLEMAVEAEVFPWTLPTRVEAGQLFVRLLPAALRAAFAAGARTAFPLAALTADELRQPDTIAFHAVAAAAAIDGEQLLASHAATTLAADLGASSAGDVAAIAAAADGVGAWRRRIFGDPPGGPSPAWQPDKLAYNVTIATPDFGRGEQAVLAAPRYSQGRLDWYAFDAAPTGLGAPAGSVPPGLRDETLSFVPTCASFAGMPNPRFWEMEDRRVNFGTLNAKTTDHLLLVFAEMGLVYGNDWFVIPYEMPVNSLCQVLGLVVTDVFGDRTLIPAANDPDESKWQRWSLFSVAGDDVDTWSGRYFWLPASLTSVQESEPIEVAMFGRDEMANLAWAVETTIPDGIGRGIETRLTIPPPPAPPPPAASPAAVRYTLGTTVPENWIPLVPVHMPGSLTDIRFQRGQMPPTGGAAPAPRGKILGEIPTPFYIAEEEIPVSGVTVSRRVQRTRWYDGRTYLWIGRANETGRGGASSHLRFDQIDDPPQ
jgi:hypothetical protein